MKLLEYFVKHRLLWHEFSSYADVCRLCPLQAVCEGLTMFLLDFLQALRQTVVSWAFVAICDSLKLVLHSFIVLMLFVVSFGNITETLVEVTHTNTSGFNPVGLLNCIC